MVVEQKGNLTPKKFGMRFKLARMANGMSVADAAQALGEVGYKSGGVTEKTIWMWESGDIGKITVAMLEAASEATKQKITYFLGLTPLEENFESARWSQFPGLRELVN